MHVGSQFTLKQTLCRLNIHNCCQTSFFAGPLLPIKLYSKGTMNVLQRLSHMNISDEYIICILDNTQDKGSRYLVSASEHVGAEEVKINRSDNSASHDQ